MAAMIHDLRVALRGVVSSPVLSVGAILTLGLGIGMTGLMFSLVYGAIFRGLPFPEEERIVRVSWVQPSAPDDWQALSIHDLADLRQQQRSVVDLAGVHTGTVNLAGNGRPVRYDGAFITPNGFQSLQVRPLLGRTFHGDEGVPGASLTLILGHHVWEKDFGSDPDILGRIVRVNGETAEVIGVMPPRFKFPDHHDLWVPDRADPLQVPRGQGPNSQVYGRLAPGVSMKEASAELNAVGARIAADHPEDHETSTLRVDKFSEPPSDMKLVFLTMLGAVLLVLLVACTNVANLLLARAAGRTRNLALMMALGASRGRIVSKLLAEAVVLVVAGMALGIGLAWVGLEMVLKFAVTSPPPFWFVFTIDRPILLFVIGASAMAALVAGVVPGLKLTGTGISEVLKDEGRGSSSLRIGRLSRILVVTELALSVGLLMVAGLFVKGMVNMRSLDHGIFQDSIMTARVGLFETDFPGPESRRQFFADLQRRLLERPEVTSACLSSALPGLGSPRGPVAIQGIDYATDQAHPQVGVVGISPGYFTTFGVQPVAGRDFTTRDDADSQPVAIVNRSFAQRFFPDGDAIGHQLRQVTAEGGEPWRVIVGVVPDLYVEGLMGRARHHPGGFYVPVAQGSSRFLSIAVRGQGEPEALGPVLRDEVTALHADTPVYWVRSMARALREEIWYVDLFGGLFAVFGALALLLAAGGLYAVMATSVAQRTREIGVRMALGAETRNVLRMILGQGAVQVALGLVLGLALAGLLTRGLKAMLFGVEPWDISVLLAICSAMLAAGVSASMVPARHACAVDPAEALRAR